MKYTFILFYTIFITSCIKEKVGFTKTYIKNSTTHSIKLLPFNGNTIDIQNSKTIPALSTVEAYSASVRGKLIEPCFGTLLQPYDSVLVTYDDVVKIPHIKFSLVYSGIHRILFSSNRSISNADNYVKQITKETKFSLEGNFTYTFTEQDYLDAR